VDVCPKGIISSSLRFCVHFSSSSSRRLMATAEGPTVSSRLRHLSRSWSFVRGQLYPMPVVKPCSPSLTRCIPTSFFGISKISATFRFRRRWMARVQTSYSNKEVIGPPWVFFPHFGLSSVDIVSERALGLPPTKSTALLVRNDGIHSSHLSIAHRRRVYLSLRHRV
jgi:hypothetical protein